MASKDDPPPKRLNRAVGVSEALNGVLAAALKKRGFATRDLLARWAEIAPKPYDVLAVPAELKWPRGAGHEGATLYLRCAEGQRLALQHQAPMIASAVNRYFGYFLVREVKLSAAPFTRSSASPGDTAKTSPEIARHAEETVGAVADPPLKDALRVLGEKVLAKRAR